MGLREFLQKIRFTWALATRGKSLWSRSRILLAMSLSLGVAALVALEGFSLRIENTIKRDTKSMLAADFQIHSWRPFDESVKKALQEEFNSQSVIEQMDFVSSLRYRDNLKNETVGTVAARALAGRGFPFYGNFVTEPQVSLEDLEGKDLIVVDKGFATRGVQIGDQVKLGRSEFKVIAFLKEEPQSVAGAFALGLRVIFHKSQIEKTGLAGRGARIFQQLLVRSPLSTPEFKEKFRKSAPDPHWRIVSPEHANRQAARVLDRLRNFLGFVGLTALLLGGVGIFTVFRSQFLAQLGPLLTLRCLGVNERTLLWSAFLESLSVGIIGLILGSAVGLALESLVATYARQALGTDFADFSYLSPLVLGCFLSLVTLFLAVWVPMREILKLPVSLAIRQDDSQTVKFTLEDGLWLTLGALILIGAISRSLTMSSFFILGLIVSAAVIGLLNFLQSAFLKINFHSLKNHFRLKYGTLGFLRKMSQNQTVSVCLGLSLFLVLTLLWIASSLRGQLDIATRFGVPNVFVVGIPEELLMDVKKDFPELETTPITQARLLNLNSKPIQNDAQPVNDDESERFFQTREYFITRRKDLGLGERVLKGSPDSFGPPIEKKLRVSIEESFAKRMDLKVGDSLGIEISGVPLESEIRSIRKVDWFNLQPNFFIVVHPDDIEGAPLDSVGFARIPSNTIVETQNRLMKKYPEISVVDAEGVAQRLLKILDQLSFAVLSMSLFSIASCFFVFLGLALSKGRELTQELALWRALGTDTSSLLGIISTEICLAGVSGVVSGVLASLIATGAACRWVFDIPLGPPPFLALTVSAISGPFILVFVQRKIAFHLLKKSTQELFRDPG